jgi:Heme NO binding associated
MDKLNAEMEHTNELLYQMMPKTIADKLRNGDEAGELSQVLYTLISNALSFLLWV